MIFDSDSSWQEYLDESWPLAVAETGNPNEADCANITYCRTVGDVTCGEAFDRLDEAEIEYGWLLWAALSTWHILSLELRDRLVSIIAKEPPSAATLYVKHPDLTSAQDEILYASFSSVMPVVTRGLKSGSTKRVKG